MRCYSASRGGVLDEVHLQGDGKHTALRGVLGLPLRGPRHQTVFTRQGVQPRGHQLLGLQEVALLFLGTCTPHCFWVSSL